MPETDHSPLNRAERRRREREAAKVERMLAKRAGVAKRIAPGLEANLTEARDDAAARGWDDVAEAWQVALNCLGRDAGLELQDAVDLASLLISQHVDGTRLDGMRDRFASMLDVAEARGWDDVAGHVRQALAAVDADDGEAAQRHARAATDAISAHQRR